MGEIGEVPNLQVKIDNWGRFFLQRLHHFYRNKCHCDLTLLFSSLDSIKSVKVHRVVLYACTDYFETLDIRADEEHGDFLELSKEMHPDVVMPIISFMYTGKLEYPTTMQQKLYEAADKLGLTVLTKLLKDPSKQNSDSHRSMHPEESNLKTKLQQYEKSLDYASNYDTQDSQDSYLSSSVPSKQVEEPFVTLTLATKTPPQRPNLKPDVTFVSRPSTSGNKSISRATILSRNTVSSLTSIPSKPKMSDLSLPAKLPGRKLPIWKPRKVPLTGSPSLLDSTNEIRQSAKKSMEPQQPQPTRFEWDEDLQDPTTLKRVEDAFDILSYDKAAEIIHPIDFEDDIPDVRRNTSTHNNLGKRNSALISPDSPPSKRPKEIDLRDMKEYGKQQQLRNEILCSEDTEDALDADEVYNSCNEESQDATSLAHTNFSTSTPKPILKTVSKPEPSPLASKRVRFSLEGKENNDKSTEPSVDFTTGKSATVVTKQKTIIKANEAGSGKHAKIVQEMLKKYPNLATRGSVKFKVVTNKQGAVPATVQQAVEGDASSGNKSSSSSVSYIYLVNENSNPMPGFHIDRTEIDKGKEKGFDVDNKNGPWLCYTCNDYEPIGFDSYYNYRKHFVEVHELKIDARICEYCGVRNSKRNYLLFHLYTKHGIKPPNNVSFPKCPDCDYIALSDALLVKHRGSHDLKEGLTCYTCNASFKSFASMQSHLASDFHVQRSSEKEGKIRYICPYCQVSFSDRDSLGKHVIMTHWGKGEKSNNRKNELEMYDEQSGRELPKQYDEESQEMEMEDLGGAASECQTSSELESLSNVASGIATSLNLVGNEQTVIYYEQQTESQDIGGEATVMTGDDYKEYMITENACDIQNEAQYHNLDENEEPTQIENEDSNSRASNAEEVLPTSCSDHDYSEPQAEDTVRQIVSTHAMPGTYSSGPQLIQQILPDQRLVFSTQPNVVFQPSRLNMPQRVLIAPTNVVLSQIGHPGQNVIFPQVISSAGLILSDPVLRQPGNLVQVPNNTVVFTNQEVEDSPNNFTSMEPSVQDPVDENPMEVTEDVEDSVLPDEVNEVNDEPEQIAEEEETNRTTETIESMESMESMESERDEETEKEESSDSASVVKKEGDRSVSRIEAAKIVDDWDEANDNSQSVENRSDGPSRPEF